MDPVDLKSLEGAVEALESPTWAMRVVNLIGMPIEAATKLLPAKASAIVSRRTAKPPITTIGEYANGMKG